jgi:CheY-like chemotaxis protein
MSQMVGKQGQTGYRTLVVDDQAEQRDILSRLLMSCGHAAQCAEGAEQALQLLHNQHFDLCLCDWRLDHRSPCGNFALLARIKDIHPHLPVLMYSGWDPSPDLAFEARDQGAVAFVKRLELIRETNQVISRAIARHQGSLADQVKQELRAERGVPRGHVRKDVESLLEFVEENYGSAVGMEAMAQAWLQIKPPTEPQAGSDLLAIYGEAAATFKRVVDLAPMAYLKELRIRTADRLVRCTGLPFHEIAEQCGFPCYRTFDMAFRKKHGKSPRAARAESRWPERKRADEG